jgi:hypothetical protein
MNKAAHKKTAAERSAAVLVFDVVKKEIPSLAGLAATYSRAS